MSIKNPTSADLAHLKEGDEVDVSFIAVPFPVRLQTRLTDHGGDLRAGGWTVRSTSGAAGPVLLALHSPLPPAPGPPPVGQCRRGPDADREIIADQVIPRYAMLDLWAALQGDVLEFEAWRDSCTYGEAWAQLVDWARTRAPSE